MSMGSNAPFKPIIRRPTKKYIYKYIFQWEATYGRRAGNDKKAIDSCMETESAEYIRILKNEFTAVSRGLYDEKQFDKILGAQRKKKFKNYMSWAKHMLVLMASYKG